VIRLVFALTLVIMGGDVQMDDVNKGKRLASTPLKEAQKKSDRAQHSPQEKATRFNVREDQAIVPAAAN
jgi:hypothetical protein